MSRVVLAAGTGPFLLARVNQDDPRGRCPRPTPGKAGWLMANTLILAEGAGHYLDFGIFHISVTNALIMGAMIVLFVLAVVIPFPHHKADDDSDSR